jgi:hypothetical protein
VTLRPVPRLGRGVLLAIFLVGLGARLAAIAHVGFSSVRFGDARAYLFASEEIVRTGRYPLATERFYFRAPGYPAFLVLATLGKPERIAIAKVANACLGALGALLIAVLSARIFRSRVAAAATGGAAALHPGLVSLSTDVQSEPLFLLLLLGAGFLLLVASDRPSSNLALGAGALLALSALTRPSALALAPLLAAPLWDRRYPTRARLHLGASALAGFLAALAPWTLRNALTFRELVPVNDAAGSAFYQGNSDWMVRFYGVESRDEYRRWLVDTRRDLEDRAREANALGRGSPSAKSRYFVRKAIEQRMADPAGWLVLLLRKTWDWLRPYPNPLFWPRTVVWATAVLESLVMLLAGVGLATAARRGVRNFSLAYLFLAMAAHVALIVVWRYRLAYWEPALLLYAIPGGARLAGRGVDA